MVILLSSVEAKASTPWEVNVSNYRYDMSIYLDVSFASGKMDYSKYDVAIFSGEECRGIAEVLPLNEENECLYLRVRSNVEKGEELTFKYYNKETEEIEPIDGVSLEFESNGRLGYPSEPYSIKIVRHYVVTLTAGTGGSIDNEGGRIAEGTEMTITAIPAEGYHFVKWSDGITESARTITVNSAITLTAEFEVNSYKLIYKVDGTDYKEYTLDYGTAITPEAYPQKEGHTFGGWEGLPQTMPASDVTATGTFTINSYNAVFKIGDEVVETITVVYGQAITAPQAPQKEGHTFAGWQNVPEAMPAQDIEVIGSYTINSYTVTFMIDGEVYETTTVEYGAKITLPTPPEVAGYIFNGWSDAPETMPAEDIIIEGKYIVDTTSIGDINADVQEKVVFNLNGQRINTNNLSRGMYIINGKKTLVE